MLFGILSGLEGRLFNRFPMLDDETPGGGGGRGYADEAQDDDPNDHGDDLERLAVEPDDDDDEDAEAEVNDDDEEQETEQQTDESADETEESGEDGKSGKGGYVSMEDHQRTIDRLIARERSRYEKMLEEKLAQRDQEAEAKRREEEHRQWVEARTKEKAQLLMDRLAYDEETARALAAEEVEKELRIAQLEHEAQERRRAEEATARMYRYGQARADAIAKNPLAAKYAEEVDAVSQHGTVADWNTAFYYVLGQKVASGELTKDMRSAAEQRTLANVNKRRRTRVEKDSQPGPQKVDAELTKEERMIAAALGVKPSDYAAHRPKPKKR